MKQSQKTIALWSVLILAALSAVKVLDTQKSQRREIKFSQFIQEVKDGKVAEVTFKEDHVIAGTYKAPAEDGRTFFETVGDTKSPAIFELLQKNQVTPNYERPDRLPLWLQIVMSWFPMILTLVILFLFMRQIQIGGGKAMSFGKSRARMLSESKNRVTFEDVAGADEAKQELQEIIEFLKDPKKFTKLGGRIPKGVLLMGSPGTGKTLLARAIAGEAKVPFFSISGSDFVEMFVGVGASRVRDLFEQGKKHAPCIIFIDEIDAVGRHRGAGLGGGHDEREQTLNQLLVEMDGFESTEGVILIAATNRPDVLDPALQRPGRFDRRVLVPPPDVRGREAILNVHTRKTPLDKAVDLKVLARGTPGFSGADLENLVNEAALLAARFNRETVEMKDFEGAKDKILMGAERRNMVMTEDEKKSTAYHEAGHAIVGKLLPGLDPIHKVTIIPRGRALGVTVYLPERDRLNLTRTYAENMIAMMMGGRIAEELIFNHLTTGASDDIKRATELARDMVCVYGMSDSLGPLAFGKGDDAVFLGREISSARNFSEHTAQLIDAEVRQIIDRNYNVAKNLLSSHLELLHSLAKALLEHETLDGEQIAKICRGENVGAPSALASDTISKQSTA